MTSGENPSSPPFLGWGFRIYSSHGSMSIILTYIVLGGGAVTALKRYLRKNEPRGRVQTT